MVVILSDGRALSDRINIRLDLVPIVAQVLVVTLQFDLK